MNLLQKEEGTTTYSVVGACWLAVSYILLCTQQPIMIRCSYMASIIALYNIASIGRSVLNYKIVELKYHNAQVSHYTAMPSQYSINQPCQPLTNICISSHAKQITRILQETFATRFPSNKKTSQPLNLYHLDDSLHPLISLLAS